MYDFHVSSHKLVGESQYYNVPSFKLETYYNQLIQYSATQMQIYCMEELHRACAKGTIRKYPIVGMTKENFMLRQKFSIIIHKKLNCFYSISS